MSFPFRHVDFDGVTERGNSMLVQQSFSSWNLLLNLQVPSVYNLTIW